MLSVSRAASSAASASRSSKDRVANAGLGAAEQPAKPASPPMTNARRDGRGGGGRIDVPQMKDEIMRSCMSDMSPAVVAQGNLEVGPLAHSFTCDETEDLQMERFCATNCVDVKWYVTVRHYCKATRERA